MAMTLVDCGVGGQEVEIVATLWIPDRSPLSPRKDHGERMVIMGSEVLFTLNSFLGGRGMVAGIVGAHLGVMGCWWFEIRQSKYEMRKN